MAKCVLRKGSEIECGICMMKTRNVFQFSCGHWFHMECIMKMLERNKMWCPICKIPFDGAYAPRSRNNNTLDNFMRGMVDPLLLRRVEESQENEIERNVENEALILDNIEEPL